MHYVLFHMEYASVRCMQSPLPLGAAAILEHLFQMLQAKLAIRSLIDAAQMLTCFCSTANLPWVSCFQLAIVHQKQRYIDIR